MTPDPELESALRAALQRQPPPRDLAPAVLARLQRPAPRRRAWLAWAAAACLLLVALAGVAQWRQRAAIRQQTAARADARQLAQALNLAAARLDRVQRRIARLSAQ